VSDLEEKKKKIKHRQRDRKREFITNVVSGRGGR